MFSCRVLQFYDPGVTARPVSSGLTLLAIWCRWCSSALQLRLRPGGNFGRDIGHRSGDPWHLVASLVLDQSQHADNIGGLTGSDVII